MWGVLFEEEKMFNTPSPPKHTNERFHADCPRSLPEPNVGVHRSAPQPRHGRPDQMLICQVTSDVHLSNRCRGQN